MGAGIGVLSWLVFLLVDKPLGMSTEISKWSGALTSLFTGKEFVSENAYWASKAPKFGYSTVFLIATAAGAWLSAKLSGDLKLEKVPSVWADRFGEAPWKRYLGAFVGGVLLLFGARMAGGCTSGHGISGSLQLAASSWLFFGVMFIGGLATAKLMFPNKK